MFGLPLTPILYAVALLGLLGSAGVIVHEHDARIRAEDAAAVTTATMQEQLHQARNTAALATAEAADARNRAIASATIKTEIARAPSSQACAGSPAVRAALDGLRLGAGVPGAGQTGDTGRAADVPGGSAGAAHHR